MQASDVPKVPPSDTFEACLSFPVVPTVLWVCVVFQASVLFLSDRFCSHSGKVPSQPWLPAVLEKRALGPPCGTLAPQPRIHGFFSLLGRHAVTPDRLPPYKQAEGLSFQTNPCLIYLYNSCGSTALQSDPLF